MKGATVMFVRTFARGCRAAILAAGMLAAACGHSTPASPDGSLAGSWSGSIVDDTSGTGSIRLQISQAASGLSGTWLTTFPDASRNQNGSLSGLITEPTLSLFMTQSVPLACGTATLTGTLGLTGTEDGSHISGTYTTFTCAGADGGSIAITKDAGS